MMSYVPVNNGLMPNPYCPVPTAHCLLPSAYCYFIALSPLATPFGLKG
jgi:hypothetical protein